MLTTTPDAPTIPVHLDVFDHGRTRFTGTDATILRLLKRGATKAEMVEATGLRDVEGAMQTLIRAHGIQIEAEGSGSDQVYRLETE